MKKILILIPALLCSCNTTKNNNEPVIKYDDYGVFLGRIDNDVTHFSEYKYIAFEFDEFTDTNINRLNNKGVYTFAYLNVGSLETYRDYYEDYESLTFKDYDNWPDERWIDVSNNQWQNFVVNSLAKGFKERKAFGVYIDNVDVYTIAKEEGLTSSSFASGLKNIIKGISNLGLKVLINGGSEFLDDMIDVNDEILNSIWGYQQEEVFSLITNYEQNIFSKQNNEDKEYYQEIASLMKEKGKEVFLIEYTTDNSLKQSIKNYCNEKQYHYYISSDVDLK